LILLFLHVHQPVFAQPTIDSTFFIGQEDSAVLLDAVHVEAYQVSGSLRSIPGSLSVLTGESIVLSDGTNMAASLNTLPGVNMQSGTYTTNRIVIRGMGSRTPYNTNRIRSYLNDIPMTSSDGVSTPEELDLQNLGRIEVVKGPSSALYGSGLGGSINLYTPVKLRNEGHVTAQCGSYNTLKTHVSGSLKARGADIWTGAGLLQSHGYRENNQYWRTSLLSTSAWEHPGWSIDLTLLLMGVDAGIPSSVGKTLFENDPQAAAPTWKAIEGYKKYFKGMAGVTLANKLSKQLTNRLTLFARGNDSYERRPFNNLDDWSFGAGVREKLNLHTGKADWVFGTEWISEQYSWRLDENQELVNENREVRNHLNVFAMAYYKPGPKLNVSVAGALNFVMYKLIDLYSSNGDQSGRHTFPLILSPRMGINYTPLDFLTVYASAGHGFSLPSPEETLLPEGEVNTDIKPEQGFQFEAGTRIFLLNGKLEADGAFYWIELNDLLVTKRVTEDIFTGTNAGRTRHRGFELMLNSGVFSYQSFPGKLSATFSYTRSLNRFISFTDDSVTYDGNDLPGIPDETAFLQLNWAPVKLLGIIFDLRYTGDQYLDDGNTLGYAGYGVCNLKVNTRFKIRRAGTFNVYAGINNLADIRHASMLIVNAQGFNGAEPRYYYPGLPRHMYAGIQYSF
jgi:iron complex outermembrane receptor protein